MNNMRYIGLQEPKYNLLLVRHGKSIWNLENKFTGWSQIPLSDEGILDAFNIRNKLHNHNLLPNKIFTSNLKRAIFTSEIIKNNYKNIPIKTSWRLNEKNYGDLEGVTRKYISDISSKEELHNIRNSYLTKPIVLFEKPVIYEHDFHKFPFYPIEDTDLTKYCICKSKLEPATMVEDNNLLVKYNNNECKNCNKYNPRKRLERKCNLTLWNKNTIGESNQDVIHRLFPLLHYILEYELLPYPQTTLIVTHKHPVRLIMKHFLKISDDNFVDYKLPKKTIIHLQLDQYKNYLGHDLYSYDK